MKKHNIIASVLAGTFIISALFFYHQINNTRLLARDRSTRIFKEIPDDTARIIHYLGKTFSPEEYSSIKKQELKTFNEQLKKTYHHNFKMRSTKYFNIAYRCSDATMDHLQNYLTAFFSQIYPRFFIHDPGEAFHVVYFEDKTIYEKLTGSSAYGFYSPQVRTLTTYAYSGHGTLWHELIHAFIDANMSTQPQEWFSEGFASFYEMAFLNNGRVDEGYTNWRMPQLHEVIKNKSLVPLHDFMIEPEMKVDFGYAEARFLFCYLWVNNRMDDFVKAYLFELSPNYSGKKLGAMAINKVEELTGKDIKTMHAEYLSLAMAVKKNQKLYQKK